MGELFAVIEEYCIRNATETEAEYKFYRDLIDRVHECDPKAGSELENKFLQTMTAVQSQSFRNGFKTGVCFLLECLKDK